VNTLYLYLSTFLEYLRHHCQKHSLASTPEKIVAGYVSDSHTLSCFV